MAAKRKTCTLIGFALAAVLITPRIALASLIDPRTQLGAAAVIEKHAAPIDARAEEIATDINHAGDETRAEPPRSLHTITPLRAHPSPKTRVMGSDDPDAPRVGGAGHLSLRMHWGINYAYGKAASRSLLGAGGGGYGPGPTIHPGPLGYAGMIPGGMAATSLYHGIGTSLEALNYAQGAYGLGRLGLGLGRWAIGSLASRALASSEIFFSQSSVRGLEEIAASMQANGWVGAPVDIVSVGGRLVTIDNTRVAAAYLTGTPVQAVVHGMNELLPASMAGRFVSAGGVEATTWGEAIMIRIGAQNAAYRSVNPLGSWFIGVSP